MSQDGPLIDLVAKGKQDEKLLTTELDKSLFSDSFTKHTNFSKGSINIDYQGHGLWGSTLKFIIPKDGDLLSSLYLNLKLPEISIDDLINVTDKDKYLIKWVDFIGNALIDKVTLRIGGQIVHEIYGLYMQIHTDIYDDDWNKLMMLGYDDYLNLPQKRITSEELYIPLQFWFTNDFSKALPVVALNHHDIEVEVKIRDFHSCYSVLKILDDESLVYSSKKIKTQQFEKISLEANMIYLDIEERKKIVSKEHEFLITQVQRRSKGIKGDDYIEINFNHPVKELFFIIQPNKNISEGEVFNFSSKLKYLPSEYENISGYDSKKYKLLPKYHLLEKARIMFNGKERIAWRNYKYYYYLQNYENFRNSADHYTYIYSFSINPLSNNPTGSCNFSRIDNAQLQIKIRKVPKEPLKINTDETILVNGSIKDENPGTLTVFATNYNFLIVKNGMAGLKYTV